MEGNPNSNILRYFQKNQNLFKIEIMKNGRKSKEFQDISERLERKNLKFIQNWDHEKWKKIQRILEYFRKIGMKKIENLSKIGIMKMEGNLNSNILEYF